jgi:hypothetical protein
LTEDAELEIVWELREFDIFIHSYNILKISQKSLYELLNPFKYKFCSSKYAPIMVGWLIGKIWVCERICREKFALIVIWPQKEKCCHHNYLIKVSHNFFDLESRLI